jgi:hypothetical protein
MPSPNRQSKPNTFRQAQEIQNASFDEQYQIETVAPLGYRADLDAFVPLNASKGGNTISETPEAALRVDTSVANTVYIGRAPIGTDTASAAWQIKKIDTTTGANITWAGSGNYNQVYDNRAALTYA